MHTNDLSKYDSLCCVCRVLVLIALCYSADFSEFVALMFV